MPKVSVQWSESPKIKSHTILDNILWLATARLLCLGFDVQTTTLWTSSTKQMANFTAEFQLDREMPEEEWFDLLGEYVVGELPDGIDVLEEQPVGRWKPVVFPELWMPGR
jgi:hypothetical protein